MYLCIGGPGRLNPFSKVQLNDGEYLFILTFKT